MSAVVDAMVFVYFFGPRKYRFRLDYQNGWGGPLVWGIHDENLEGGSLNFGLGRVRETVPVPGLFGGRGNYAIPPSCLALRL